MLKRLIPFFLKHLPLLIIIFVFILQIPFLDSDADQFLSTGVGPWTDEGLYTMQIKNFLYHGIFSMKENEEFLKTPLFHLTLFPVFFVFGSNLIVARCFIILLVLFSFFYFTKQSGLNFSILLFTVAVLTQYHIFHYTHLLLSEMLCIGMILLGFRSYIQSAFSNSTKQLFIACLFLSVAYFTKFIFSYVVIIIPVSTFAEYLFSGKEQRNKKFKRFISACLFSSGFVILYLLVWYLPNYSYFNEVLKNQTDFSSDKDLHSLWQRTINNYHFYKADTYFVLNIYILYINAILCVVLLFFRKKIQQKNFLPLFIFVACWLLLEMFKFSNIYLPSRYIVSGVVANILFLCLLTGTLVKVNPKLNGIVIILTLGIFCYNMFFYYQSFNRRSYQLKEINDYISGVDFGDRPFMGNWAPSCSWSSKSYVKKLCSGYNDVNTIETYHPKAIIAESEKELISLGINISEHADSSRTFKVNDRALVVYWIKQ